MSNDVNGHTMRERLLSRLIIDPSGCLLWTGYLDGNGYGRIMIGRRARPVHRIAYEVLAGPIPGDLPLDHLCRVRHCAAPAHLEAVPMRINTLRGNAPPASNAAKNRCVNGHAFDLLNTYWRPDGSRGCRTCNRAACRRYQQRLRERAS